MAPRAEHTAHRSGTCNHTYPGNPRVQLDLSSRQTAAGIHHQQLQHQVLGCTTRNKHAQVGRSHGTSPALHARPTRQHYTPPHTRQRTLVRHTVPVRAGEVERARLDLCEQHGVVLVVEGREAAQPATNKTATQSAPQTHATVKEVTQARRELQHAIPIVSTYRMYVMTPRDHRSTFSVYGAPDRISGAAQRIQSPLLGQGSGSKTNHRHQRLQVTPRRFPRLPYRRSRVCRMQSPSCPSSESASRDRSRRS